MNRDETLNTAGNVVNGARAGDFGDAKENFTRIAKMWEQVLGVDVDPDQVALCMVLVKVARLTNSSQHSESWVDIAGYAALGAEVATEEKFSTLLGTDPKLATSAVPIVMNIHDIPSNLEEVAENIKKGAKK